MGCGTILFTLSGLGLGNSTRCDAIIEELQVFGYEIDLLTSDNGERFFSGDPRIRQLHRLEPLDYSGSETLGVSLSALRAIPTFVGPYWRNVKRLKALLKTHPYSAIVMDSEYSVALLKRHYPGLVFAVNNADGIISDSFRLLKLPRSYFMHMGVELLDFLFHLAVPDYVLSPHFSPQQGWKGNRLEVGPVVRTKSRAVPRRAFPHSTDLRIAIVSGGSRFATPFTEVQKLSSWKNTRVDILGRKGSSFGNIHFHSLTKNLELLKRADILVINAGFSSVSEAVFYKKPCVVVPLPGHVEQLSNARWMASHGLGLLSTEDQWIESLCEVRKRLTSFRKAHSAFLCPLDGAREIANTIHGKLTEFLDCGSKGFGARDSLRG